jgi:hypothetical protein
VGADAEGQRRVADDARHTGARDGSLPYYFVEHMFEHDKLKIFE